MKVGTTPVLTEKQRNDTLKSCFLHPSTPKSKKIAAMQAAAKHFGIKIKTSYKGKYDEVLTMMTNWDNYDMVNEWIFKKYGFTLGVCNAKIYIHPNY